MHGSYIKILSDQRVVFTFTQCAARDDQNKKEIERLLAERKLISLRRKVRTSLPVLLLIDAMLLICDSLFHDRTQDEIEKAMEQTRRAMGEQITALEKEIDHLAERNAKLICKQQSYMWYNAIFE